MIKYIKSFIILLITVLACMPEAKATHIVGGSLEYRYLGDNRYEFTLVFRRDCFTGSPDAEFDDPAKLYFYKSNGALAPVGRGGAGFLNMYFNPDDTLGNTFISDCGFEGTQVCVQETRYVDTIRLPYIDGGYTIAYQRCCRNPTLQNILDPLDTGGTWWTHISEESLLQDNSSPQFGDWPGVYICANKPIDFDHSATDADGDSLVYRLYTPYSAGAENDPRPRERPPFNQVAWNTAGGYSLNNLLGSDVPLTIDPATGLLSGIPDFTGQYLIGVAVDEYRNGKLIGTTRRDFQYNIRICSAPPTAEFLANGGNCEGQEVKFDNQSISASDYKWNFNYPSTDPAFISTEENPTFSYAEPGVYQVQLIATRGTDKCRDEIIKEVTALSSDIQVDYDLSISQCVDDGYVITLVDNSTEPDEAFDIIGQEWTITQGGESRMVSGNNVNVGISTDTLIVSLRTMSNSGCSKSVTDTILPEQLEHVTDFSVTLDGCSADGIARLMLKDLGDSLNQYDNTQNSIWRIAYPGDTINVQGGEVMIEVPTTSILDVRLFSDFGGGCGAFMNRTFNTASIVPQAGYHIDPIGCNDASTVDLEFVNDSNMTSQGNDVSSISWSISYGDNEITSQEDTLQLTVPKDTALTVQFITSFGNGCIDTIQETIVPGPFATINYTRDNPFLICSGDTVQLVSNPTASFDYTWSTTDGLIFEGDDRSNPLALGTEDRMYVVTVSDGLCTVTDTLSIDVLDANNLTVTGSDNTCDGTVELVASGGILDGEFEWSLTPTFDSLIYTGDTLVTSFEGDSMTYYVSFTGIDCGAEYVAYTVRLSDVFSVATDGSPVRVCIGDTVQIVTNYNIELEYSWTPMDGLVFPEGNDNAYATKSGMYSLEVTDGLCNSSYSVEVLESDVQDFKVEGDSVLCSDRVLLTASGATGDGEYEWSDDLDFDNIIATGAVLDLPAPDNRTTYYLRYTDTTCGSDVIAYSVRPYSFGLEYINQWKACPGDTVPFPIVNTGEDDLTFMWTGENILEGADQLAPVIAVAADATEPFQLYLKVTNSTGCEFMDTINISIGERKMAVGDATITECGGKEVCFSVIGEFSSFVEWTFGDPESGDDNRSFRDAPCHTFTDNGLYTVILRDLAPFCSFPTDTLLIPINDTIIVDSLSRQIGCIGDTVTATATSPSFGVGFVWVDAEGDTLSTDAEVSVVIDSVDQVVTLHGVDSLGCSSSREVVFGPFDFDIQDNIGQVLCEGQESFIDILVNGDNTDYTFSWSPTDLIQSGADSANPVFIVNGPTTLSVDITYTPLGCVHTKTYDVDVTSFEIDVMAEPDTVINPGEFVDVSVVDPQDGWMYEWSNGETDEIQNVGPEESTTYTVTVTDSLGCTAEADIFIRVREPNCDENDVYLPSAFSPNGDNVNDVLFVRSNFIDEIEFIIYDRWGEEVFKTTDPTAGWDGTFKGEQLAPDAFAYYMNVLCINGVRYIKKGNVSLLR